MKWIRPSRTIFALVLASFVLQSGIGKTAEPDVQLNAFSIMYPELKFLNCNYIDRIPAGTCESTKQYLLLSLERLMEAKNFTNITRRDAIDINGRRYQFRSYGDTDLPVFFREEPKHVIECMRSLCARVFSDPIAAARILEDRYARSTKFFECIVTKEMTIKRDNRIIRVDPFYVYFFQFSQTTPADLKSKCSSDGGEKFISPFAKARIPHRDGRITF